MKKKFIVIMIIVILLVIAFFILIKEYLVKIPAGFSLYRNSKMGVSFAYPVNWFMEDKIKDETIVITPPDYDKDNIPWDICNGANKRKKPLSFAANP